MRPSLFRLTAINGGNSSWTPPEMNRLLAKTDPSSSSSSRSSHRPTTGAIRSALDLLPPTVNRPENRIKHFPKALDPDRSYIYSKKIEKTRKPTSMGFRIFNIMLYATVAGVFYWSIYVRDWDDRVWGGKARRDRLKRLALHRDLTPEEEAILARPEPPDRVFLSPMFFLYQIPLNFAIQKEIRKARREQYLETQRLEKAGLDVPVQGLKVNWSKYGLDAATLPMYQEGMDEEMDWSAVLLEEE